MFLTDEIQRWTFAIATDRDAEFGVVEVCPQTVRFFLLSTLVGSRYSVLVVVISFHGFSEDVMNFECLAVRGRPLLLVREKAPALASPVFVRESN